MARLQGRIVINPKVLTDDRDALAIAYNEAYRLVMEAYDFQPQAEPTQEQQEFFADTAYADDPLMLRRTITARVATYDASVPNPTPEQYQDAVAMLQVVQQAGVIQNPQEEDVVNSTLADMEEKAAQVPQMSPAEEGGEETDPEVLQQLMAAQGGEGGGEMDPAVLQQLMAAQGGENLPVQAAADALGVAGQPEDYARFRQGVAEETSRELDRPEEGDVIWQPKPYKDEEAVRKFVEGLVKPEEGDVIWQPKPYKDEETSREPARPEDRVDGSDWEWRPKMDRVDGSDWERRPKMARVDASDWERMERNKNPYDEMRDRALKRESQETAETLRLYRELIKNKGIDGARHDNLRDMYRIGLPKQPNLSQMINAARKLSRIDAAQELSQPEEFVDQETEWKKSGEGERRKIKVNRRLLERFGIHIDEDEENLPVQAADDAQGVTGQQEQAVQEETAATAEAAAAADAVINGNDTTGGTAGQQPAAQQPSAQQPAAQQPSAPQTDDTVTTTNREVYNGTGEKVNNFGNTRKYAEGKEQQQLTVTDKTSGKTLTLNGNQAAEDAHWQAIEAHKIDQWRKAAVQAGLTEEQAALIGTTPKDPKLRQLAARYTEFGRRAHDDLSQIFIGGEAGDMQRELSHIVTYEGIDMLQDGYRPGNFAPGDKRIIDAAKKSNKEYDQYHDLYFNNRDQVAKDQKINPDDLSEENLGKAEGQSRASDMGYVTTKKTYSKFTPYEVKYSNGEKRTDVWVDQYDIPVTTKGSSGVSVHYGNEPQKMFTDGKGNWFVKDAGTQTAVYDTTGKKIRTEGANTKETHHMDGMATTILSMANYARRKSGEKGLAEATAYALRDPKSGKMSKARLETLSNRIEVLEQWMAQKEKLKLPISDAERTALNAARAMRPAIDEARKIGDSEGWHTPPKEAPTQPKTEATTEAEVKAIPKNKVEAPAQTKTEATTEAEVKAIPKNKVEAPAQTKETSPRHKAMAASLDGVEPTKANEYATKVESIIEEGKKKMVTGTFDKITSSLSNIKDDPVFIGRDKNGRPTLSAFAEEALQKSGVRKKDIDAFLDIIINLDAFSNELEKGGLSKEQIESLGKASGLWF